MFNLKGKKNGFTLAETVIVCTVFAVMILGVIFAINRAYVFLNDTRLRVMATNFARGGVEMVYNIRDTNWREHPGDRDAHRLNTSRTGATTLSEGIYIIKEGKTSSGDSYIYLTGVSLDNGKIDDFYDIEGFFNSNNNAYKEKSKLTFTGTYSYNSGGMIATGELNELMDGFGATFYRIVRVYGIYRKNIEDPSTSADSTDSTQPKELRFCVKVFYDANGGHHATELCSIMTNFME